jgi:hypothetical protein
MKCQELLKMLNEYVEGDIDPAVCQELEILFVGGQERKRWVLHYGIDSYRRALDEALGLPVSADSPVPIDADPSPLPVADACAVLGPDGQPVDCPACRIDDASCGRPGTGQA